jgi:methionyl-tRNA synthetase
MIFKTLGIEKPYTGEALNGQAGKNEWSTIAQPCITQASKLLAPQILFAKVEDSFIAELQSKLGVRELPADHAHKTSDDVADDSNLISIDDFKKIQLRTAKVLSAERVPKSEKLLRLIVDTGSDQRQILAGIAKYYTPEEMVGKMVVVVVNLKPAKLMGMESQGMLLAANSDAGLSLVAPISFSPTGAEVR